MVPSGTVVPGTMYILIFSFHFFFIICVLVSHVLYVIVLNIDAHVKY